MASAAEFSTYVACSTGQFATPSHVCQVDDVPGAFFESPEAEVEYDVCVTFPDAEVICAEEQEAEEGVLYVNAIFTDLAGNHFVNWYVEGTEVGEWAFRMDEPAPPPALPALPAPLVVPPAVVPGPSQACLKASQRVRKAKAQLTAAKGAKAKKAARKRLNRAKAARKAAC